MRQEIRGNVHNFHLCVNSTCWYVSFYLFIPATPQVHRNKTRDVYLNYWLVRLSSAVGNLKKKKIKKIQISPWIQYLIRSIALKTATINCRPNRKNTANRSFFLLNFFFTIFNKCETASVERIKEFNHSTGRVDDGTFKKLKCQCQLVNLT